jgi:hypothetical protein
MRSATRKVHTLYSAVVVATLVTLVSTPTTAQEADDPTLRLREAIENHPDRPPGIDTALVFTNLGRTPAKVSMKAYRANGAPAGSADLEVPGNGVAYVLASDLDEPSPTDTTHPERRFIGKVEALGRGNLTGTAVLVGGPVTDLPVIVRMRNLNSTVQPLTSATPVLEVITQIIFPLVAAY